MNIIQEIVEASNGDFNKSIELASKVKTEALQLASEKHGKKLTWTNSDNFTEDEMQSYEKLTIEVWNIIKQEL
jgi:hypothetical protein